MEMRFRDNGRDLGHVIFKKYLNNVYKKVHQVNFNYL